MKTQLNKKKLRKLKGNTNPTTPRYVITLEGDLRSEVPPSVQCTCGWVEGPSPKLLELGNAAKQHAIETGHQLRQH